jgi:methyl-accepting chemotaxis protein WspA
MSAQAGETLRAVELQGASVAGVGAAVERLSNAVADFSSRFAVIHEQSSVADSIVEGVSHLAEQANLLSVNAAVEAERAGEHGTGFLVVAREIRRLSDQSSAAVAGSRRQIQQLHSAVAAGVMALDRFGEEIRAGSESALALAAGFPTVLGQVRHQSDALSVIEEQLRPTRLRLEALERSIARLNEQTQTCNDDVQSMEETTDRLSSALLALTPEALWKTQE